MDLFYRDTLSGLELSWADFVENLNSRHSFAPICHTQTFYQVFENITISLLYDFEIIMVDGDLSKQEMSKLLDSGNERFEELAIDPQNRLVISSKAELLSKLSDKKVNWSMTLFTSGTTGLPKMVTHGFETLTRNINVSEKKSGNIWGFAYNPTHMAGIQVLLEALLNGNSIVRLFNLGASDILKEIRHYSVTNISATPTFYRMLLPPVEACESVLSVAFGGEKFDKKTRNSLSELFPNARFINIFASTEAGSLFLAEGDEFTVRTADMNFVKIIEGELILHQSLLGKRDGMKDEWYRTGDMVEITNDFPLRFRFVSRNNEMINVGGYKINPTEVEEAIRSINGVIDARVFAKSNSVLGNIVCCNIVRHGDELNETTVRLELKDRLQEFKIPRIIYFVDKLAISSTGKANRN